MQSLGECHKWETSTVTIEFKANQGFVMCLLVVAVCGSQETGGVGVESQAFWTSHHRFMKPVCLVASLYANLS